MSDLFSVKPGFLLKLMAHSSNFNSDKEIMSFADQIFKRPNIEQDAEDSVLNDKIPDHLQELKNALEGALADDEDYDEDPPSKK